MLKGCQKRVIWVRNPESKWFDEAYFILSDEPTTSGIVCKKENDMIREANKIIAASPFASYYGLPPETSKKSAVSNLGIKLKWFSIGSLLTALCAVIASLLI